tara:strand:- start:2 stop:433 length:432 start_codon:yes stop_codon:yes gene_type:complete
MFLVLGYIMFCLKNFKTFTFLNCLIAIVLFSSSSFGEWQYIGKTKKGYDLYFENKDFKKSLGYIYFFGLYDFNKSNNFGTKSVVAYYKLSCINLKYKSISDKMFKKPMGKGSSRENNKPFEKWKKSSNEDFTNIMKELCSPNF